MSINNGVVSSSIFRLWFHNCPTKEDSDSRSETRSGTRIEDHRTAVRSRKDPNTDVVALESEVEGYREGDTHPQRDKHRWGHRFKEEKYFPVSV